MKNFYLSKVLVLLISTTVLLIACQKEQPAVSQNESPTITLQDKVGGVIPDDELAVSKVPLIMSAEFYARSLSPESFSSFLAKGRPLKPSLDVTAPSVSITSPANGASVAGTINITVNASDNVGVKSVSLSIDGGSSVTTSSAAPFTNAWNSGTVANGTHTLTVTASDAAGNKTSSSIQVSVNNVAPGDIISPTVTVVSPTDQSSVTGTVTVNMSATDNVAVSSVSISIDNTIVSTTTSYSWNTSNYAAGTHIVMATAKDAAGNQGTKSVTVTVNTVIVPPPTSTGVQLIMPSVGNQGGEGSCVAFSVGYATRSAEQYYRTNSTSYSNSLNIFSPEFLYNQVKLNSDCGSGTSIVTALDFIVAKGICTFQSMPYTSSNGCSLLPTSTQTAEALNYRITGYSKIINTDRGAIKSIISQNHPVIIIVLADYSFQNATSGFIWKTFSGSGNLPHSIAICGYDDSKNAYKVMNSWGTAWGDAGYSWIDYSFFETGGKVGTYCYVIN